MPDKSVKLNDLMQTGKKKGKSKPYAHSYKEAKAACRK